MARFFSAGIQPWWCKWADKLLALLWILGLICGYLVFRCAGNSVSALMRRAVCSPVSIVSLLTSLLLPFLFSALAVYLSRPQLLPVIAFCKAFLMAYVSLGVHWAFGSAFWLVRSLLMAGDLLSLPVLYSYWLQHVSSNIPLAFPDTAVCFLTVIVLGCLDYFYLSPLLLGLF